MAASGVPINQVESCLNDLRRRFEECEGPATPLTATEPKACLAEFLAMCAESLSMERGPDLMRYSNGFISARDIFVQAGLDSLMRQPVHAGNDWLQIGIRPRGDREAQGELCRRVASLARRLLGTEDADNFFYMNKPPGMRLRFEVGSAANVADLSQSLRAEVEQWREERLIDFIEPGIYEPESPLFGGPRSMTFVHALFTVDSLIWLDYHTQRAFDDAISPAWLVSLAMLSTVFAGLDITGWEDLGVWDRVRDLTGRNLGRAKVSLDIYAEIASKMRDVWIRRDRLLDELHPSVRETVALHDSALFAGAEQWRSGYFRQPDPVLGPRAAAAFYVIFHWNRAALSYAEQALLAESLSERIFVDGRK